MSQELNEITAIYQSLAHLLRRIELLYKRVSELEQGSKEKDELIEMLNKENDYPMKEQIAELEKSLKKKNEECERLKKDNEQMLREIINFRDRGLRPYGLTGF